MGGSGRKGACAGPGDVAGVLAEEAGDEVAVAELDGVAERGVLRLRPVAEQLLARV